MKKTLPILFLIIILLGGCKKVDNSSNSNKLPPIAPTELSANLVSQTSVNLSWVDKSTNELGFKLERKVQGDAYSLIATIDKEITSYLDNSVVKNKTYTYRVYSYNVTGPSITYSNEVSVSTSAIPILSTNPVTDTLATSAISGGDITDDGGSAIISRGVVWSLNPNPTIDLITKTNDTTTSSKYTSLIQQLIPNTLYFVRAYAVNNIGIGYGNEISFNTKSINVPTLTTNYPSDTSMSSAKSGGDITDDGGSAITSRGVVWSLNHNPTIDLTTKTIDGSGSGKYTSNINDLLAGQNYYVRAYAINNVGVGYGNEEGFATSTKYHEWSDVTDFSGNKYKTIIIGNQVWMNENLRTTVFQDGSPIQDVSFLDIWKNNNNADIPMTGFMEGNQNNLATYGRVYNYFAVINSKNICPTGWRIPSMNDWKELETTIGSNTVGKEMKSILGWNPVAGNGNNLSGFNGLPGGIRDYMSDGGLGFIGSWWSSTATTNPPTTYYKTVQEGVYLTSDATTNNIDNLNSISCTVQNGLSIRCIKN